MRATANRFAGIAAGVVRMDETPLELEHYAWPGGYPIGYFTEGGSILCPDCANRQIVVNIEQIHENAPDSLADRWEHAADDIIAGYYIIEEAGGDIGDSVCDDCGRTID